MEPVTVVFLLLGLWPYISSPDPVCPFVEEVTIIRSGRRVDGELTTYLKCDELMIVERHGEILEK